MHRKGSAQSCLCRRYHGLSPIHGGSEARWRGGCNAKGHPDCESGMVEAECSAGGAKRPLTTAWLRQSTRSRPWSRIFSSPSLKRERHSAPVQELRQTESAVLRAWRGWFSAAHHERRPLRPQPWAAGLRGLVLRRTVTRGGFTSRRRKSPACCLFVVRSGIVCWKKAAR